MACILPFLHSFIPSFPLVLLPSFLCCFLPSSFMSILPLPVLHLSLPSFFPSLPSSFPSSLTPLSPWLNTYSIIQCKMEITNKLVAWTHRVWRVAETLLPTHLRLHLGQPLLDSCQRHTQEGCEYCLHPKWLVTNRKWSCPVNQTWSRNEGSKCCPRVELWRTWISRANLKGGWVKLQTAKYYASVETVAALLLENHKADLVQSTKERAEKSHLCTPFWISSGQNVLRGDWERGNGLAHFQCWQSLYRVWCLLG